mmetsp:Transcript_20017/g.50998  ORF Transcript_20017/g.50998 Transcript_20017/m.50998 type:complete len:222 (+) Transcript_20017:186-851(+)
MPPPSPSPPPTRARSSRSPKSSTPSTPPSTRRPTRWRSRWPSRSSRFRSRRRRRWLLLHIPFWRLCASPRPPPTPPTRRAQPHGQWSAQRGPWWRLTRPSPTPCFPFPPPPPLQRSPPTMRSPLPAHALVLQVPLLLRRHVRPLPWPAIRSKARCRHFASPSPRSLAERRTVLPPLPPQFATLQLTWRSARRRRHSHSHPRSRHAAPVPSSRLGIWPTRQN